MLIPRKFQNLDLIIINTLTLVLVVAVLLQLPVLQPILGLSALCLFPGYVLVSAIYPGGSRFGTSARLALSLILSIAVCVLLGLFVGATPISYNTGSVLVSVSLFTLIVSGIAWYLRNRNTQTETQKTKTTPFIKSIIGSFRLAGWGYRCVVIALICVILGGLGLYCYVITKPMPARAFSEFYILGEIGKTEDYPVTLMVDEEVRVIIGVENHEIQETNYRIEIKTDQQELNNISDIILKSGELWQQTVGFELHNVAENQKVEFLLYKNGTSLYETLYLWVDVTDK